MGSTVMLGTQLTSRLLAFQHPETFFSYENRPLRLRNIEH
jgi:hypothetical protein